MPVALPKTTGRVLPDISKEVDRSKAVTGKSRKQFDNLAAAFIDILAPLRGALDDKPDMLVSPETDNGHEPASMQDMGLRIMLGTFLQFLHRQNHGPIIINKKGPTGKIIGTSNLMSNKERMDDSHNRLASLKDVTDPDALKTLYYAGINEERYDAYQNIYGSLMEVYRDVFREDWKPQVSEQRPEGKKIDVSTIAPEQLARWQARLAAAKTASV